MMYRHARSGRNGGRHPLRGRRSASASAPSSPSAFTLVELLVVIAIIGILAGLITAAAMNAIPKAKIARMGLQIAQLSEQLEHYKNEVGSYPPDFSGTRAGQDTQAINLHLRGHFRNRNPSLDVPPQGFDTLDPAEALVFWLQGFSKDPIRPLTGAGDRQAYFTFPKEQLRDADGDGWFEFYPRDSNRPYVYYRHDSYVNAHVNNPPILVGNNGPQPGISQPVKPYVANVKDAMTVEDFIEPKKFQIICAGLDHEFGTGGQYPDGVGYAKEDRDNLTNFSEGRTLEDAMP